jgi:DNA-binding response OmpR family regulator
MKTYHILLGNCEELLNDFIEALFREVCEGKAVVKCTRAARAGDLVRQARDREFELVVQIPHNLLPEVSAPTPMRFIAEAIQSIRTIKSERPVPVVTIVGPEERSKYEPLLLEAGADCVLELPFDGDQLTSAIGRLLQLPARLEYLQSKRWFFAGVLMRGLRRLAQA